MARTLIVLGALFYLGLAADLVELFLELQDLFLEILPRLLQGPRLADLRQHQKQDDGAEAAADAVEKRQAQPVRTSTPPPHGQSSGGLRKDPPVRSASFQ